MPICLAVCAADLGETGNEGRRNRKAKARDRGQDGVTPGQAVVGFDALEDLAVEQVDIFVGSHNTAIELSFEELALGRGRAGS